MSLFRTQLAVSTDFAIWCCMVGRIGLSTFQNVAPPMDGLYVAARKVGAKVKGKGKGKKEEGSYSISSSSPSFILTEVTQVKK